MFCLFASCDFNAFLFDIQECLILIRMLLLINPLSIIFPTNKSFAFVVCLSVLVLFFFGHAEVSNFYVVKLFVFLCDFFISERI